MKRNFNNSANSDWDSNLCSERVWLSMSTKSLILEEVISLNVSMTFFVSHCQHVYVQGGLNWLLEQFPLASGIKCSRYREEFSPVLSLQCSLHEDLMILLSRLIADHKEPQVNLKGNNTISLFGNSTSHLLWGINQIWIHWPGDL